MKDFWRSVAVLITLSMSTPGAAGVEVVVYGQVNGTVTLPKDKDDQAYMIWYFGSEPVLSYTYLRGQFDNKWPGRLSLSQEPGKEFSLVINNVKEEEFKTFRCEVKKGNAIHSAVDYVLRTVRVPTVDPLLAGSTLSLRCVVQQPLHNMEVEWLDPQGHVRRPPRPFDGSLTVQKVTWKDNGAWQCVVHYDGREARASTAVTVMDLSRPSTKPLYASASSNRPLTVSCSLLSHVTWQKLRAEGLKGGHWSFTPSLATGAPGHPQRLFNLSLGTPLMWMVPTNQSTASKMDGSALQRDERDLSLLLKGVTESNRGKYTCALIFENGVTLERTTQVEVLQVLSSPRPELLVGQQANLTCSLGRPLTSGLTVKWVPPTTSAFRRSLDSAPHSDLLAIQKAVYGDGGKWRCELWSDGTKETAAEITLKIDRAPIDGWLLVTICAAAVIFVLLLILTVILFRRRRQRAMRPRRRKHRFCRCKDPQPKGFYRT